MGAPFALWGVALSAPRMHGPTSASLWSHSTFFSLFGPPLASLPWPPTGKCTTDFARNPHDDNVLIGPFFPGLSDKKKRKDLTCRFFLTDSGVPDGHRIRRRRVDGEKTKAWFFENGRQERAERPLADQAERSHLFVIAKKKSCVRSRPRRNRGSAVAQINFSFQKKQRQESTRTKKDANGQASATPTTAADPQ
nr:hypothetical protein [Pandoravirus belohorizontensis]